MSRLTKIIEYVELRISQHQALCIIEMPRDTSNQVICNSMKFGTWGKTPLRIPCFDCPLDNKHNWFSFKEMIDEQTQDSPKGTQER